jgi:hypothetical protein
MERGKEGKHKERRMEGKRKVERKIKGQTIEMIAL